ncbi:MAG: DUF3754 domain-containing protein [Pseudomonadota bacterium]
MSTAQEASVSIKAAGDLVAQDAGTQDVSTLDGTVQPQLEGTGPATPAEVTRRPPPSHKVTDIDSGITKGDLLKPDDERPLEKFIPITRFALIDRLSRPKAWPHDSAASARRLFRYLDYWRHQRYAADLLELEQTYEPFNPDSDMGMTRAYTPQELATMQARLINDMTTMLVQANYEQLSTDKVSEILTETHYGLDLHVDFDAFEECLLFYRGASNEKKSRRSFRKFYFKEEFDVDIYRRLFLLFKLKPFEDAVVEKMNGLEISRKEAEKLVRKQRAHIPDSVTPDRVYMKLFKNIPRSDVEMVFPNTVVRYRMLDKIMLGGGGLAGLGGPIVGAISKFSLLANPFVAIPVIVGFGGAVFRGAMNFVNKRNKYMVIMAQNLYFHSMADNRGAMITIVDRAAEEDVKEEILLYSVIAKIEARRQDLDAIDKAIERYLKSAFGVEVDFDLDDALSRLLNDGLVTEQPDGRLVVLRPHEAAEHIDAKWDVFLDELENIEPDEGAEIDKTDTIAAETALGLTIHEADREAARLAAQ